MKTDFANWSEMVIIVYLGKYIQVNKSSNLEFSNSEQIGLCALMIHTKHYNNARSYKTNRQLWYNCTYVI